MTEANQDIENEAPDDGHGPGDLSALPPSDFVSFATDDVKEDAVKADAVEGDDAQ